MAKAKRFTLARRGPASANFTAKNLRHSRENCFRGQSLTTEYNDSVDKVKCFAHYFYGRDMEIYQPIVDRPIHQQPPEAISMNLAAYIRADLKHHICSDGAPPCKPTLPGLSEHYEVSVSPVRSTDGESPRLDNRLHQYLIRQSRNRFIQSFFRQYTATYYTAVFDYATPEADVVAKVASKHRQILEALIAKHWAQARQALSDHIRAQRPILKLLLDTTQSGDCDSNHTSPGSK